ncbi:D-ribose pyranase [Andreprevotia sp. IGB-42]|uniref:D-ribose pyranase n=1 Tax=Andreprevotia sp. IGB-42 TaxID=2497473 RepID=UPI00135BB8DE|nr:D-ribose pyranase [Andreprevotia sp. IGB-42]KAF0812149.1 D-ribose pyranase [Andreprevotia sp. IGB-42]
MKKSGHLNRDISRVLAGMGHTDCIVIADCGLPIPPGVECIDLALQLGEPGFLPVLETLLADFQTERAVFACEALEHNSAVTTRATAMARTGVAVDFVPHDTFKTLCREAKAVIRTGEATPYANVILHSGVIF